MRDEKMAQGFVVLSEKIQLIEESDYDFILVDFGTRRRFSKKWHNSVVDLLDERIPESFIGTSNVYLAREYDLKPIGTMAHEFISAGQSFVHPLDSQSYMLHKWADEYKGSLGIALSDTLGRLKFFEDFNPYFAKLYDGVRHDSGDPFSFGDEVIKMYESYKIDPLTKSIVFSDGLDIRKAIELLDYFVGRIKVSFGIGTNLTNDVGIKPPNIVIKMVECNGRPIAKLSDVRGKVICEDLKYLDYLKEYIPEYTDDIRLKLMRRSSW